MQLGLNAQLHTKALAKERDVSQRCALKVTGETQMAVKINQTPQILLFSPHAKVTALN